MDSQQAPGFNETPEELASDYQQPQVDPLDPNEDPEPRAPLRLGRRGRIAMLAISLSALVIASANVWIGGQRRCEASFIVAARDQLRAGGWSGRLEYRRTSPGSETVADEPLSYQVESANRWLRTFDSPSRGVSETLFYDGRTWVRDGSGAWSVLPQVEWPSPMNEIWASMPGDAVWTPEAHDLLGGVCRFAGHSDFNSAFDGLIEIADGGFWPRLIRFVNTQADGAGTRSVETRELTLTPGAVTVEAP